MPIPVDHAPAPVSTRDGDVLSPRARALLAAAHVGAGPGGARPTARRVAGWLDDLPDDVVAIFGAARDELRGAGATPPAGAARDGRSPGAALADLLGACRLREERRADAKRRGAAFTPAWLAARVARNARRFWRQLHRTGRAPAVVADVSCGAGAFLPPAEAFFPGAQRIVGIDVDPLSIAYCRLLAHACEAPWALHCADALLDGADDAFDVLIGNPPYVRSSALDPDHAARLRSACPTIGPGSFDLSVAFIEHALERLAPGGLASYVVTSKFMTAQYGQAICRRLARAARLVNVEDFQDQQVFPGYTTYTCVLTFGRQPPARRFTVTRFPAGVDGARDPGPGVTASMPVRRLHAHPWEFASGVSHGILRRLRDPSLPLLTEVVGPIVQGLRTGANGVYVVGPAEADGLEAALLRPYVNGEDIRAGAVDSGRRRLLYPYRVGEGGEPVLVGEDELRGRYPAAASYLARHRAVLEERVTDDGAAWYAYSRRQNLDLPRRRKLLVREMMPRAEFAADAAGEVAFCAGYALDASGTSDEDLALWTAVLCTPTMEYALRHHGTQLQSGWFRLLKHHLARVRVPALAGAARSAAHRLARVIERAPADGDARRDLDEVVASAFGLAPDQRAEIDRFLRACHPRSGSNRARTPDAARRDRRDHRARFEPVRLEQYDGLHRERPDLRRLVTFAPNKTLPRHRWYAYTQGFSGPLVDRLLDECAAAAGDVVLDPFAGCGTTLLASRVKGFASAGVEISPLMTFVAEAKVRPWRSGELERLARSLVLPGPADDLAEAAFGGAFGAYLRKAYAPAIMGQLLALARYVAGGEFTPRHRVFLRTGLLAIMEEVSQVRKHGSHYRDMLRTESVGLQKLNIPIVDPAADVRPIFLDRLARMIDDVRATPMPRPLPACAILNEDCRATSLAPESIDVVVTSPPYLNRNNYIAQQKAELAILDLVTSRGEYRRLVASTFRSHVERLGPAPVSRFEEVRAILDAIDVSAGNNPKIPHMIAGYFEDLADMLAELFRVMKPGGTAAFVVGNTRWGGVVVPVDHLLLRLAEDAGFTPQRVLVTRHKGNSPQQMRRHGRIPVRESIVVFRKPGGRGGSP